MAQLPRGIDPQLLLSQVQNTMPYLFSSAEASSESDREQVPPASVLRKFTQEPKAPLTHFEYFRLCLCAHYLTCATPVPTDVDNQIRRKLWPRQLPLEIALQMTELVLESRDWGLERLSSRSVRGASGSAQETESLSAHFGEWFTVAAAAYCALSQYPELPAREMGDRVFEAIASEVDRQSEIFGSLWRAGQGLGCLKASVNIAHNFGDLDRVMDQWELEVHRPLRKKFYKLAASPFGENGRLRYQGRLWVAGELYKSTIDGSSMALENHRHFALRKPRCLRQSPRLWVPIGPFFDDWGRTLAQTFGSKEEGLLEGQSHENLLELIRALRQGWERLPKTHGYGRALRGILEVQPGLDSGDFTKSHPFRTLLETSQESFEKKWSDESLKLMDEIPSKA